MTSPHDCTPAFVDHRRSHDRQQSDVREPDHQVELIEGAQFGEQPDANGRSYNARTEQHQRQRDI
jgi:hypothetical protein